MSDDITGAFRDLAAVIDGAQVVIGLKDRLHAAAGRAESAARGACTTARDNDRVVISQRLDLREGIWTCPSCGAQLESGDLHGGDEGANLEHRDDCAEVARMAVHWNWPPPADQEGPGA